MFGLALSGGSVRGAAHIGVLKALEENSYFPSWISGTSAGSIIAGLYACGYSAREMERIALSLGGEIFDIDYMGIFRGFLQLLFGRELTVDGLVKGKNLDTLLRKLTKEIHIKKAKIPLAITAVNINNGQSIVFVSSKRGLSDSQHTRYVDDVRICDAIRASIAIPVVFKPKMIEGMRLVDGGVTDNVPVGVLKEMGAKRVVGVNLGYCGQMRKEIDNILEIGNQSLDIMAYQITKCRSKGADCMINPHIYDVGLMEVDKIKECIQRGYEAALENMHLIKKAINS